MDKQKILLIEDDEDSCLLFKYLLSDAGYEVTPAGSAEEALEILKTMEPDIIVADILLPGIDGKEMMLQIRKEKRFKKLCAIAVSALASLEEKYKVMQSGFDDFITKPIEAFYFAQQIREIYERCSSKTKK